MIEVGKLEQYKAVKHINDKYIICWGLTHHGKDIYSWNYASLTYKPSIDKIKDIINSYYNELTKTNIENNFKWNGMNIFLSIENQIDYKLLFDTTVLLNGKNLPEDVKFKIGKNNFYYTFEDIDDMKDLIVAMNNHIRKYLKEGYKLKESIDYEDYIHELETL